MKSYTSSLLALAAAGVQASHLPTPPGGQIGVLHFPVMCTAVNGAVSVTLDGIYTATAPLQAEAGQKIYYTDVTASLTIPHNLIQAAGIIGANYANTKVFVDLALDNASPATYTVFPGGYWVNHTVLDANQNVVVNVPQKGVLPDIGPITMGAANTTNLINLGAIKAEVYLYGYFGNLIYGPLEITCPKQDPNILIGVVNILPDDGQQTKALDLKNGYKPNFQAIGEQQEAGCFDFNYSCRLGIFGPFPFDVVACGGINAYDNAFSQFYLENVTADITIPSGVVDAVRNIYKGATTIDTDIESFYVGATNTFPGPQTINGVQGGYQINGTKIPSSGSLTLSFPKSGVTRIGPYTAGTNIGQLMFLTVGNSTSHAVIRDSTGKDIGEADIVCQPPSTNYNLIGITIGNPLTNSGGSSSSSSGNPFGGFGGGFGGFKE